MNEFKVAGLAEKDGTWFAFGTYEGRFLQLPISDIEADEIRPNLVDDRTHTWTVDEERMVREGEALIVSRQAQPA